MGGLSFFDQGNNLLPSCTYLGVVQFPSLDQKFLAESNATARINAQMIQFSNDLIVYDRTKDRVGGGVISRLISEYPKLNQFLLSLILMNPCNLNFEKMKI